MFYIDMEHALHFHIVRAQNYKGTNVAARDVLRHDLLLSVNNIFDAKAVQKLTAKRIKIF